MVSVSQPINLWRNIWLTEVSSKHLISGDLGHGVFVVLSYSIARATTYDTTKDGMGRKHIAAREASGSDEMERQHNDQNPTKNTHASKLADQSSRCTAHLLRMVAWPYDTLHESVKWINANCLCVRLHCRFVHLHFVHATRDSTHLVRDPASSSRSVSPTRLFPN